MGIDVTFFVHSKRALFCFRKWLPENFILLFSMTKPSTIILILHMVSSSKKCYLIFFTAKCKEPVHDPVMYIAEIEFYLIENKLAIVLNSGILFGYIQPQSIFMYYITQGLFRYFDESDWVDRKYTKLAKDHADRNWSSLAIQFICENLINDSSPELHINLSNIHDKELSTACKYSCNLNISLTQMGLKSL